MTAQQIDAAILATLAQRHAYIDELCSVVDENVTVVTARLRVLRDAGQVVLRANGSGGRSWALPSALKATTGHPNKFTAIVKAPKDKPTGDRSWWIGAPSEKFSAFAAGQFGKK